MKLARSLKIAPLAALAALAPAALACFSCTAQAGLRDQLPEGTVLYARMPALLDSLGGENRTLQAALDHPAHRRAQAQLRAQFAHLKDVPKEAQLLLNYLLSEQSAPLEMAVVGQQGMLTPSSHVIIETTLRTRDGKRFESSWADLTKTLQLPPAPHRFDPKTGQLRLVIGPNVDAAKLEYNIAPSKALEQSERQLDQSKNGAFLWIDAKALRFYIPMLAVNQPLWAEFANSLDSLAAGVGSVDGQGRLGIDAYLDPNKPLPEVLRYLPSKLNGVDVKTVGEAKFAMQMSLPTDPKEVASIAAALIESERVAKQKEAVQEGGKIGKLPTKKFFSQPQFAGLTGQQMLSVFGPELAYFNDQAGLFFALRIQNQPHYHRLLGELKKRGRYTKCKQQPKLLFFYSFQFNPEFPLADTPR